MSKTALPPCTQEQCQSADLNQLHSGYVKHRRNHEPACTASREGHRLYIQETRLATKAKQVAG